MAVNYNIIPLDISDGLDNHSISAGKTYLILLSAPSGANVKIRLDSNEADQIPLDTNYGIKFDKATQIYVSADAVAGESISIGVSDTSVGDFEVFPSPTVDQIDTIGEVTTLAGISTALNTALDKIINPYNPPTIIKGETNSSSLTTLHSATLNCDKIVIDFMGGSDKGNSSSYDNGMIEVYLGSSIVARNNNVNLGQGDNSRINANQSQTHIEINTTNIKTTESLIIKAKAGGSRYSHFILQKFTLKT